MARPSAQAASAKFTGGSEFNQVTRGQDLERGGCWSHLRTHFFKALA